jgi:DNA-binding protein H-NS
MINKSKLKKIEEKIRELEAEAEIIRRAEKPGVVQLKALIKKYGLDLRDVKAAVGRLDSPTRTSTLKGRKLKPKYRNPKNRQETWAGRGREPKWFTAALKSGLKRDDLSV